MVGPINKEDVKCASLAFALSSFAALREPVDSVVFGEKLHHPPKQGLVLI